MNFSTRLKEEIESADIRYKELAAKSGVPERALYNYVATKNPSMPPADVAVKIAGVLGVSVEYLVTGNPFVAENRIHINEKKLRSYAPFIKKIDALDEKHRALLQTIVSEMADWKEK